MTDAHHPIQLVARLTGLSPHVIRIWEQRYKAVEPERTDTNRRLYSQQLGLLAAAGSVLAELLRVTSAAIDK